MTLRVREEHGKDAFYAQPSLSGDFPQESPTGVAGLLAEYVKDRAKENTNLSQSRTGSRPRRDNILRLCLSIGW